MAAALLKWLIDILVGHWVAVLNGVYYMGGRFQEVP